MVEVKFFFHLTTKDSPLIAKAISLVTKQKENHVGFLYEEEDGYYYGFQSLPDGVNCDAINKRWLDNRINEGTSSVIAFNVPFTKRQIRKMIADIAHIPYAYEDYGKFIAYYLTGKKLFKGSNKSMVCSESAFYIAAKLGIIPEREHYEYLSPGDFCLLLRYIIENQIQEVNYD